MNLNRRETQRQLILRAVAFVRSDAFQDEGIMQLKTRHTALSDAYERFVQEHQSVVEDVADEAGMNEQHHFAGRVEDSYIEASAALEGRIQDLRDIANPPTVNYAAQVQAITNNRDLQSELVRQAHDFTEGEAFIEQTIEQLKVRMRLLSVAYEEFMTEHRKIREAAVDQQDLIDARNISIDIQDKYMEAYAKIARRISELEQEQRPGNIRDEQNGQLPRLADFRLESIKVHSFDGDYSKWNEWRALYESLIHNQQRLSDTEKFHYLRKSLTGAAEQVLSGWHTIGENYRAAYEALVKVFDNSYRIIMAHLDALHKLPKASSETQEGLRSMIDTANRVTRQLRVAGSPVDHWDHVMVYMLVSRMPPRTLTNWETTQDLEAMPTLEDVLRYLERRARGIINLNASQANGQSQSRSRDNQSSGTGHRAESRPENTSSSLKCHKCNGAHPIYRCGELLSKPVAEREKAVRKLKLCTNCFRKDHEAGTSQCRAGKCRVCRKEFHNSILCPNSKGNTIATMSAQDNNGASSSGNQPNFH